MKKNLLYLGLVFLLLFSCVPQEENASDWRGPNRQGVFHETGLLDAWTEDGPELLWYCEGLGMIWMAICSGKMNMVKNGI